LNVKLQRRFFIYYWIWCIHPFKYL